MNVTIGQKVSVASNFALKRGYSVTKITKTGQITIELNGEKRRFLPTGYEIGIGSFYDTPRLVIDK